jgi:hypothetical protein
MQMTRRSNPNLAPTESSVAENVAISLEMIPKRKELKSPLSEGNRPPEAEKKNLTRKGKIQSHLENKQAVNIILNG